jgi:beta-phosphoglucomutase
VKRYNTGNLDLGRLRVKYCSAAGNCVLPHGIAAIMIADFHICEFGAVIFDWDGVLVDSGKNYFRAYELALLEIGIQTTPREIYLREGEPTPQVMAALCADRGIAISPERIADLVIRRRNYDAAQGKRQFFPGVWQLVDRLRAAGKKFGMVTGSSRKSVELVLNPALEKHFDVVITADDVKRGKPDPESFLTAASKLQVASERCLVVENAPFGIQAAKSAGCRVIALCTTLSAADLQEADWIVRDHSELEHMFSISSQHIGSA